MKKIRIYNYDTDETITIIRTKNKYFRKNVIKYLESHNYKLLFDGMLFNGERGVYWLVDNEATSERLHLYFHECGKKID